LKRRIEKYVTSTWTGLTDSVCGQVVEFMKTVMQRGTSFPKF
jgi:hypothetical protein